MIFRRDVGKLRNRRNETSGAGTIGRERRGRRQYHLDKREYIFSSAYNSGNNLVDGFLPSGSNKWTRCSIKLNDEFSKGGRRGRKKGNEFVKIISCRANNNFSFLKEQDEWGKRTLRSGGSVFNYFCELNGGFRKPRPRLFYFNFKKNPIFLKILYHRQACFFLQY